MGGFLGGGGPKGPDPGLIAAQQAQIAAQNKKSDELQAKEDARAKARKGRVSGRRQLLYADETGVSATLG